MGGDTYTHDKVIALEVRQVRGITLKMLDNTIADIIAIKASLMGISFAFKSEILQNTKDSMLQEVITT